jgi:GMP synthase (glutamine-hydrolysing)
VCVFSVEGVSSGPGKLCSFHQDTFTLPPGATLLAKSDLYPQVPAPSQFSFCLVAAVPALDFPQVFTLGSALAVQFHPEASPDIVKLWADRAVELRPMFLEKAGVAAAGVIADANAVEDVSKDAGMRLLSHWCTTLAA